MSWLDSIYLWLQAGHIVFVIFWMAGMLYLPRLYVYHHQSEPGGELERALLVQERNLQKIILAPAITLVWVFAILMLVANPSLFSQGWFHAKLALVIAMSGIHGFYAASGKKFARGERPRSEKFWRLMNEGPAILAVVIVILAVVKPF